MRIILLIIPICLGFSATLHEVSIVSFAFSPQSLTINTGDTVRWINNDTVPHTSTSDNGDWDSEALSYYYKIRIEDYTDASIYDDSYYFTIY